MHSHCCYLQNRGVEHTAKIGFASVTGTAEPLFFSLYWLCCRAVLLLCYTVGGKAIHSAPSIQCTFAVFSWFGLQEEIYQ